MTQVPKIQKPEELLAARKAWLRKEAPSNELTVAEEDEFLNGSETTIAQIIAWAEAEIARIKPERNPEDEKWEIHYRGATEALRDLIEALKP